MEHKPLISVIVPIYKVEKYLSRCIESLLRQSFTDFELLLINDGSPDNSGAISDHWAKLDARIRVFHQENAGLSAARNKGLANAKGRYAVFVDSDDYVDIGYLAHLVHLLPDDKAGLGFMIQGYKRCSEDGNVLKSLNFNSHVYSSVEIPSLLAGTEFYNMFSACAKLFDCHFLKRYDLRFDTTLRFSEDVLFILECMLYCDYISVGDKADYNYISYEGTMSKLVTPFVSEYKTFSTCKKVIQKIVVSKKLDSAERQGIFKCIHLLFCRTLKSDYHHSHSVPGGVRRKHLHSLVRNDMDYLVDFYQPDYIIDKIGRHLLMKRCILLYDVLFTILFKLKVKKMFSPPGAF